jgi:hypothetical protein
MKRNKFLIVLIFTFLNLNAYGSGIYNFSGLQWNNGENEIEEAHVGDEIIIKFAVLNIPDGETINIEIWENSNENLMDFIDELQGTVKNGIIEILWTVELDLNDDDAYYYHDIKENGFTYIDYVFVIKYKDLTIQSKLLSVMTWINQLIIDKNTKEPVRNTQFFVILMGDDDIIEGYTDDEGRIKVYNLKKVGNYKLII